MLEFISSNWLWLIYQGDFVKAMSSTSASCCFRRAIVRNRLQVNWIQHLTDPSIQVEHLSDAFTQNVCVHHNKTKQKIRIFFSWSHLRPNWLNLSALFNFPLETEGLHVFNHSMHLDCKEGESNLLSLCRKMMQAPMSVKSGVSL